LEGHRASGKTVYRQAAEQLLGYALAELFDRQRGAFVEGNNPDDRSGAPRAGEIPLDANGVMADALLRAHRVIGRAEYLEVAKRVLASLGGKAKTIVGEDADESTGAALAQAVHYLKAYGQLFPKS
jgi:uncharacterized protein YyaL (SSP411 family)